MEAKELTIMDRVKTFEDALNLADEKTRQEYLKSVEGYNTPDEIAYKKLKLIIKVVNEEWVADYKNPKQIKWYLWFADLSFGAGSGLCCANFAYASGSYSLPFGSRLNFKNKETALYVGNQFMPLWKEYLL